MIADAVSGGGTLHLPDLYIKGFGGIKELSISRLGRVTLVAGKNGVGKTTLLEAVRVYAARGEYRVLSDILSKREVIFEVEDDEGKLVVVPQWEALFYGRPEFGDASATVGPSEHTRRLTISEAFPDSNELGELEKRYTFRLLGNVYGFLKAELNGQYNYVPLLYRRPRSLPLFKREEIIPLGEIHCESLGPELPANNDLAGFWDKVALTDDEPRIVQALNVVSNGLAQGVAMIGDEKTARGGFGRRAVVKTAEEKKPVPLPTLGGGTMRLLGVALALATCKDGFLLIDEAENGIHHSIQGDFWTMVLKTAQANNVQVLATTHSWDCVAGFAQAAEDADDVDVALVRLEKDGDDVYAVEYSERNLKAAAGSGIEVR